MLDSFLIFVGVATIAVKLLDFYMSDGQKKWLNDRVVRMWDWLDRAKRVPFLDLVRTRRSQRNLAAVAICAIVLQWIAIWIWGDWSSVEGRSAAPWTNPYLVAMSAVGIGAAMIGIWLGRRGISMMLQGKTALNLFARASVMLVFLVILARVVAFPAIVMPAAEMTAKVVGNWFFHLFIAAMVAISTITFILFSFWVVSVSLVLFIYLGSLLLYIVELTVRRIAEYPKGPVLAVGTLMGMIGALIKAFGAG